MTNTTVIHIKDRSSEDIYIGRGSKWGNPFRIGRDGTREEVVKMYEKYFLNTSLIYDIHELVGKRLVCYCHPEACHGDILAKYANQLGDGLH